MGQTCVKRFCLHQKSSFRGWKQQVQRSGTWLSRKLCSLTTHRVFWSLQGHTLLRLLPGHCTSHQLLLPAARLIYFFFFLISSELGNFFCWKYFNIFTLQTWQKDSAVQPLPPHYSNLASSSTSIMSFQPPGLCVRLVQASVSPSHSLLRTITPASSSAGNTVRYYISCVW